MPESLPSLDAAIRLLTGEADEPTTPAEPLPAPAAQADAAPVRAPAPILERPIPDEDGVPSRWRRHILPASALPPVNRGREPLSARIRRHSRK